MNLFAQAAFRPDAGAIAHKQHPDHQFRINGWATSMAVKFGKMRTNTPQINEPINRTQQVVLGNVIFQRKLIKQCCLRLLPWSQHRKSPYPIHRLNQRLTIRSSKSFSTQLAHSSHSLRDYLTTAVREFARFLTCAPNGCLYFRQYKNLSFSKWIQYFVLPNLSYPRLLKWSDLSPLNFFLF